MLVIGLTGGIGTGKSTVAAHFAAHGVPIIDADIIARKLTYKDQPAFNSIVAHFKEPLLQPDGQLDRSKLRQLILDDPKERLWLENLLHPAIIASIHQQLAKLKAAYCIVVIPLLLEGDFQTFISRILVVDAPQELQLKRVSARDQVSFNAVEKIIALQVTREKRLAAADDVILNDGTLSALEAQVAALHAQYLALAAQSPTQ